MQLSYSEEEKAENISHSEGHTHRLERLEDECAEPLFSIKNVLSSLPH